MEFTEWLTINENKGLRQVAASLNAMEELFANLEVLLNDLLPNSQRVGTDPRAGFITGKRPVFRDAMRNMGAFGGDRSEQPQVKPEHIEAAQNLLNEIGSQVAYANQLGDERTSQKIQSGQEMLRQLKSHLQIVSTFVDSGGMGGGGAADLKMKDKHTKSIANTVAAKLRQSKLTPEQEATVPEHLEMLKIATDATNEPESYGRTKLYSYYPDEMAQTERNTEINFGRGRTNNQDAVRRLLQNPMVQLKFMRGKKTHPATLPFNISNRMMVDKAARLSNLWANAERPIRDVESGQVGHLVSNRNGVLKVRFGKVGGKTTPATPSSTPIPAMPPNWGQGQTG